MLSNTTPTTGLVSLSSRSSSKRSWNSHRSSLRC
ncbi:hypothetical protein CPAR01_08138 [Colletotrichum paranaense]|uniref:Uncharacterized protein n=2 Tax=Colletotrichum acutatum species complex TaxID=2707335 RepID=A0AAI9TVE6_9PEZI|nr:uncharacterized protein CPAR01_08138 [Colletotrichum paranaense]KAK1445243.1 hypothetical protein CCUS01_12737 [Colletotrichum cuscutae]KAK1538025.1 hypothetical protein CPAR01_08138 [Colletotrichum paranaense]